MSPTIYLSILSGLIVSLLAIKVFYGEWNFSLDDKSLDFIYPGLFGGFMVGFLIWFFVGINNKPKTIEYQGEKRYLTALKDTYETSGSFFLGSGSFDGEMKYYGYESLGDSRYKMIKFPNNSIIVEDVDSCSKSYFVEIREMSDSTGLIWDYEDWIFGPFKFDEHIIWEIHIPVGSILKGSYELDLE